MRCDASDTGLQMPLDGVTGEFLVPLDELQPPLQILSQLQLNLKQCRLFD
jgi:hypothetical protein